MNSLFPMSAGWRVCRIVMLLGLVPTLPACLLGQADNVGLDVPIVGLPCEGCEDVFQGIPSTLGHAAQITPAGEPGDPMTVTGTVFGLDGNPAPGVIVYAYQTDAGGIYPQSSESMHGALRAWVQTDGQGSYRFETVRPGSYPDRDTPEHIHLHIIEPDCCTYYIDSIEFDDDPLLTPQLRGQAEGRAGTGIATPTRRGDGSWAVTRDIRLGEGVPGHPGTDSR